MGIRIIDNKKIDLSEYEYETYVKLCKSYDRANFKGSDLFVGLFETDTSGNIIHLNPPGTRYTSMEVVCFLQNVFVNQRMAQIEKEAYKMLSDANEKVKQIEDKYIKIVDSLTSAK